MSRPAFFLAVLASCAALAQTPVTFDQILKLVKAKVPEGAILKTIGESPGLKPTPEQLLQLKAEGASDSILLAVAGAGPVKREEKPLPESSGSSTFTARGLVNEEVLTKLHAGDFTGIALTNEDLKFSGLFQQYLENYARRCGRYLPEDAKVQMMGTRCNAVYTRSGQCASWESFPLPGLYAKPELHDARTALARQRTADAGRQISVMMGQMNPQSPMAAFPKLIADAQSLASDMEALVRTNQCNGPGLQRFEENLRLFALGKQPIRLGAEGAPPSRPALNQNYTKLISDLVSDDATKWGMAAKLIRGSVTESTIAAKDQAGGPAKIVAPYVWEGLMGRKRGAVTLTFEDGFPSCLYYSETPAVCHTPARKIAAAFAAGGYQQ